MIFIDYFQILHNTLCLSPNLHNITIIVKCCKILGGNQSDLYYERFKNTVLKHWNTSSLHNLSSASDETRFLNNIVMLSKEFSVNWYVYSQKNWRPFRMSNMPVACANES